MKKELLWDRNNISPEIEIERAINFGGFSNIRYVKKNMG